MPALGFGALIPDAAVTKAATRDALEAGFRHFDCAERYRNEREVGEALQTGFAAAGIAREDIFRYHKVVEQSFRVSSHNCRFCHSRLSRSPLVLSCFNYGSQRFDSDIECVRYRRHSRVV